MVGLECWGQCTDNEELSHTVSEESVSLSFLQLVKGNTFLQLLFPADWLYQVWIVTTTKSWCTTTLTAVPAYSEIRRHPKIFLKCPKNQNRCWNKIGSPPPAGSKNDVLKFLSVKSIVIPPAKTGMANNNKTVVTKTDQTNNGNLFIVIPGARIFNIVVIKFIDAKIDEIPAKCKLKIAISTEPPECAGILANGG